jgi:serine/threonine protein kinase
MPPCSRTALQDYEIISKVGGGGFGSVFKARTKRDGTIVAIKSVRLPHKSTTIPTFAQREIQILQQFGDQPDSPFCSLLRDPIHDPSDRSLSLIFKYYPYDLNALFLMKSLAFDQIRFYLYRLLRGLQILHKANYVHRDVKPENILIDINHNLALTDFGLAREVTGNLTAKAGTQFYRAPEQLLGDTRYGTPVDIWAIGCTMYFMMTQKILFEGRSDCDQFEQICAVMGTPTADEWPGMMWLPNTNLFLPRQRRKRDFRKWLVDRFANCTETVPSEYIELMLEMLNWNPDERITAEDALKKDLFVGVESLVGKLPPLTVREAHQKVGKSRRVCDFLIDGLDLDLEFQVPKQCVPV